MRVLDTNIVIYYSRRDPTVIEKVNRWLSQDKLLTASVLTEAELMSWPHLQAQEIAHLENILATLTIIPVDSAIARVAGEIRRAHRIDLTDALIAATALYFNATLVTRNVKDFAKIKEITVEKL